MIYHKSSYSNEKALFLTFLIHEPWHDVGIYILYTRPYNPLFI
jgi:hypothetical protein